MANYFIAHTLRISADEFSSAMQSETVPELAKAMDSGQTPAKCLKSWNPLLYGNTDTFFCLWEADRTAVIETTLGPEMLAMLTCNPLQVDEIDWSEISRG